jgi:hypothetical protein
MPVSSTAWITAIVFGVFLGWALGRHAADRGAVVAAAAVTAMVGGAVWATDPTGQSALAAVSMAVGGAASALSTLATGRRQER